MNTRLFFVMATLTLMPLAAYAKGGRHTQSGVITPEMIVVGLIDDLAGDTWAESGDVQTLKFTGMKCDLNAAKCELGYALKLYGKAKIVGTCEIKNITGYDQLLEIVKYGFVPKEEVIDQVNDCLNPLL